MLQGSVQYDAPVRPDAKPGPYTTALEPHEEKAFQTWVKDNKVPFRDEERSDYDMRGYYRDIAAKGVDMRKQNAADNKMHFPDTYKTPYHKTFSNESQYATPDAPRWNGDKLMTKTGELVADETPKKAITNFRKNNTWAIPTRDDVKGEVR